MSAERKPDLHLEIAHVLFIDVVGYSKLLADEQSETLQLLNQIVRGTAEFRTAEEKGELIRLPTGDGMALVYLTKPEAPVQCALQISKAIKSYPELQLRMGIHSGSVNQMRDVNDRSNVTGAGINIAQRVMDCGDAGHILLSRRVAEDLEQYRQWQPCLHDLGECEVKHGVHVHVFNLYTDEVGNRDVPAKLKPIAQEPAAAVVTSAGESARSKHRLIAAAVLLAIALALGFGFWVVSHRAAPKSTTIPPKMSPSSPAPAEIGKPLDLPALAQKARGAVVLIVGYDAAGKIIKTGSGFFVSADGRLVTNCHVIEGIVNAQAKLESGAIYNIDGVLAFSSALDLAVLKADARDMQFLLVDDAPNPPQPGTRIAVIGSPLALEGSLSEGIVSANRSGEDGSWLQISASISPGSSGSPVLDLYGRVVGVATLIAKEGQNLNFARSSHDLWNYLQTINPDTKPKALSDSRPIYVVIAPVSNGLNIRADPSAKSRIIEKLQHGDRVFLEDGNIRNDNPPYPVTWQKVTTMDGVTGWIDFDYLAPSQPTNAPSATPQPASSIESATPEIRKAKPVLSASPQQLVRVYVKKYGVSALFPTDVFPDAKKLSNSDQSFLQGNSWTGQTTLTFSSVREPLAKVYAECATEHSPQAPSKTVQYKVLRPTWFVVSGDLGPEADSSFGFYTKGVKKDSFVVIMHFQYREDDFPFSEETFTAMSRGFDGH